MQPTKFRQAPEHSLDNLKSGQIFTLAYPMPNSCLWASRLQHPEGSEVVTKPKSVCLLVSKTSLIWPSAASLGLAYRPGTQYVSEIRANGFGVPQ